jgi:hypothetical protein
MIILTLLVDTDAAFVITASIIVLGALAAAIVCLVIFVIKEDTFPIRAVGCILLGWICLLVPWGTQYPGAALGIAILPFAAPIFAAVATSDAVSRTHIVAALRLFIAALLLASLIGPGFWLRAERMVIRGEVQTVYEVGSDGNDVILFKSDSDSIERVSRQVITSRQFCQEGSPTIFELKLNTNREAPTCP